MGQIRTFKILLTAVLAISASSAFAVQSGTISNPSCAFKKRSGKGKWSNYPGSFSKGTPIKANISGKNVIFQVAGSKDVFATGISCVDLKTSSMQKPVESKTFFVIHGAPQFFKTKFTTENSLGEEVEVVGTVIAASGGLDMIFGMGSFQIGVGASFGFGTGSADSDEGEYTVKYARGWHIFVPVELYYAFGDSAVGISAGLQYLHFPWPVEAGNPDVTNPDSRTSYIADFGYRFVGSGFLINPRVGVLGGGGLFAELRGGVTF